MNKTKLWIAVCLLGLSHHAMAVSLRVMVVVPSDSGLSYADVVAKAVEWNLTTRASLVGSGLQNYSIEFVPVPGGFGVTSAGKDGADLNTWMHDENDKLASLLSLARTFLSADLVLMATKNSAETDCGSAVYHPNTIPVTQQPPRSVSLTEAERYAFAMLTIGKPQCNDARTALHEVGHLMYLEHQLSNSGFDNNQSVSQPSPINHGYGVGSSSGSGTYSIMAVGLSNWTYVPLFSGSTPTLTNSRGQITGFFPAVWNTVAQYREPSGSGAAEPPAPSVDAFFAYCGEPNGTAWWEVEMNVPTGQDPSSLWSIEQTWDNGQTYHDVYTGPDGEIMCPGDDLRIRIRYWPPFLSLPSEFRYLTLFRNCPSGSGPGDNPGPGGTYYRPTPFASPFHELKEESVGGQFQNPGPGIGIAQPAPPSDP